MKKTLLIIVLLLTVSFVAQADNLQTGDNKPIYLSSKVPVSIYGFVSAETLYSDSQLSSFGTLNNDPANYRKNMTGFNRVVDESVEKNNNAFLSWTVQNSRFGFLFEPYDFGGKPFTADARFEFDFFSTDDLSISSVKPRIRRAYAGLGKGNWHFLFGQEWDLFSPLSPATLNIGGNLWLQGNLGFRRPQIRVTNNYKINEESSLETAASLNIPSNSMSFDDNGNTTGIPMFEGRVGYMHNMEAGKMKIYLSGLYARHNNSVAGNSDINNWGLSLSAEVPVHKYFTPSIEAHYGYSMGMQLSISSDTLRQRDLSGWAQVKSKWIEWLETNFGYGIDALNRNHVASTYIYRNQMGFVNFQFKPLDAFIIGLEYNYLRTNYKGSKGASEANAAFMNVLYVF